MTRINELIERERARLEGKAVPQEPSKGYITTRFAVICQNNSERVLNNATEVLLAVTEVKNHTEIDEWIQILPKWFVAQCAKELSQQDLEQWLEFWQKLDERQRIEVESNQKWSLSDWIYWFQPENREWFWHSGKIIDDNTIQIIVEASSLPFPWGSLTWLMRASGAVKVIPED